MSESTFIPAGSLSPEVPQLPASYGTPPSVGINKVSKQLHIRPFSSHLYAYLPRCVRSSCLAFLYVFSHL